jgi:hypothetical protein
MQETSRWQVRLAFGFMLAFVLVTGCQALWEYLNHGPGQLAPLSWVGSAIVGLLCGLGIRGKTLRIAVIFFCAPECFVLDLSSIRLGGTRRRGWAIRPGPS